MTTIPSPETITISAFALPRTAPCPRVIPLYATVLQRRPQRKLAIHDNLSSEVRYKPYPRLIRPRPVSPIVVLPLPSSPSSRGSSVPALPLTPVDEHAHDASSMDPSLTAADPVPIFIPAPGNAMVAGMNWNPALMKKYCRIPKEAITATRLDINVLLSEQDSTAWNNAHKCIETAIPQFQNHEKHWGANMLLRDQLKSIRDMQNKKQKKAGGNK
ncbi:hypothetical protein BDP27DRAFT_1372615 [Rhodocollybia butyracea]|uniref:Uncharacterized protein n=1 Tax=Rhodocollybia butyracea TaxID=206335 RepID=A0A9P5P7U5_9AGAR|nr:hypothetical protein BDP27DRAFT_1372615 [Rhodocollybia butyracea]